MGRIRHAWNGPRRHRPREATGACQPTRGTRSRTRGPGVRRHRDRRTLNAIIDLLSDPSGTYANRDDGLRRTYNQAWFTKIYIDILEPDPDVPLKATIEHSPVSQALEVSRVISVAEIATAATGKEEADPIGSAVSDLGVENVKGSISNPSVELRVSDSTT